LDQQVGALASALPAYTMSKKSDKQLKELRRLMPWNWDSRCA
jgi:hypothetical protein